MEKKYEKKNSSPVSIIDDVDVERDIVPTAQRIQVGTLPLMDLDKGLVGWDSVDDPMNPMSDTKVKPCRSIG
jgi:hypothetical protein